MKIKPRDLIADNLGRLGIVMEQAETPAPGWIKIQKDIRIHELPSDTVWWHIIPLDGGGIEAPEPLIQFVRRANYEDICKAYKNSNYSGRLGIEELLQQDGEFETFTTEPMQEQYDFTIEKLFSASTDFNVVEYNGNKIYRLDQFPVEGKGKIKIILENTNSLWEQAVVIGSSRDKKSSINGLKGKVHYFWLDKASHEYIVEYQTQNDYLYVCNGWKTEDGTVLRWTGSCGMMIEEIENGRRYRCNDGFPDCDFDELTFRIERLYDNWP